MRVLLVDHQDSFAFNLYQQLAKMGAEVECVRSDRTIERRRVDRFDAVVLSPGPGHPSDRAQTGLARRILAEVAEEVPVLGVCLGHQLLATVWGAAVVRARRPVHGEAVPVRHDGSDLFRGVPSPFAAARYHSLVVAGRSLPSLVRVTARGPGGVVMAIAHDTRPWYGVQFHPESYLTPHGDTLVRNFLAEVAS